MSHLPSAVILCSICKSTADVCFKRYYSTKQGSYYFYSAQKHTTLWAPNRYQFNHLCTRCVELICQASWQKCTSTAHPPRPDYYYNAATGQSTYTLPELHNEELAQFHRAISGIRSSCEVELGNRFYHTPQANVGKRDYFFKGLNDVLRQAAMSVKAPPPPTLDVNMFQIDDVASFSVTESKLAAQMTQMILHYCKNPALSICDGMACVGGNTISFAQSFAKVVSNEFDYERYHMLVHNVRGALNLKNVVFFNRSIVDIIDDPGTINAVAGGASASVNGSVEIVAPGRGGEEAFLSTGASSATTNTTLSTVCGGDFNILFLDPEWGGRDYKKSDKILLTIADIPLEDFIQQTFDQCPSCIHVVAKLPVNYNNEHLKKRMLDAGYTYKFDGQLPKMTVTFISRERVTV